MKKPHITQYCIRGNSRMTKKKEIISGPFDTQAQVIRLVVKDIDKLTLITE